MQIQFPYPDIPPLELPDANLIGYYHPQRKPDSPPADSLIQRGLEHPIGAPRLTDVVQPGDRVLILVEDVTRPTPQNVLLPPIIAELRRAGVGDIRILIAYGTHRVMTTEEKASRLGHAIFDHYPVLDHDCKDPARLIDTGAMDDGRPIEVNRALAEADFVLGVGHIVPHRAQGFSGGGKIVLPGVAAVPCIDHMHWQASQIPIDQLLGRIDNPIRRYANQFAMRAGLRYIVNVVLDDEERVIGVYAGDPIAAYEQGCQQAYAVYRIPVPEPADICITDSYPADTDLWQANKALFAMEPVVKPGGVVILVTPSPEGASKTHPHLVDLGYHSMNQVKAMIREGKIKAGAAAAALADGGSVVKEKAIGIMVSPGISPEDQKKLGFRTAATPQEALEQAFTLRGRQARILAFHHGGEISPVVTPG